MASLMYRLTCSALTASLLAASQAAVAQTASTQTLSTQAPSTPAAAAPAPAAPAAPRPLDDDSYTPATPAAGATAPPVNAPPPGAAAPASAEPSAAPVATAPGATETPPPASEGAPSTVAPPPVVTATPLAPAAAPAPAPEPEQAPAPEAPPARQAAPAKLSASGKVDTDPDRTRPITVKDGETVNQIATRLHTPAEAIIKANKLKEPYALDVGQTLNIPAPKAYVIQKGDTLMAISRRFDVPPAVLAELNGFDLRDRLHAGQLLDLPLDAHDAAAGRTPAPERAAPQHAAPPPAASAPEPEAAPAAAPPSRPVPYAAAPAASESEPSAGPTVRLSVQGEVVEDRARFREMRVGDGDTVAVIADRLHTPTDDLIKLNKLKKPYELDLDRILKIPTPKAYVADRGDTLTQIGRRFGLTASALAEINDMDIDQRLRPGEKIALPTEVHDNGPLREEIAPPRPRYEPPPRPAYEPPSRYTPPPAYSGPPVVDQGPQLSDAQIVAAGKGRFVWPVTGQVLSSFGPKPGGQRNDGVDVAAPLGTPVVAAAEGDVVYAGNLVPGFGNLVLIRHEDGWVTAYACLSRVEVKIKDHVRQGDEIGQVGQTGGVAQPQLHFEIRYPPSPRDKARPVDPVLLLPAH